MEHPSKKLKRLSAKIVLNIQLNKTKLSNQQKVAAIYLIFPLLSICGNVIKEATSKQIPCVCYW